MATYPLHRPLTLLVALGAVALLVVTWSKVVTTISSAQPVQSSSHPTAIIWDDRVFQDPATLARWLRSKGTSYLEWSRRHPRPAAIIEHRPLPPVPAKTTPAKTEPVKRASPAPAVAATSSTGRGAITRDAVFTLLLLLALVLSAAAALPAPLRRRFPALTFRIAQYRGAFAASAAAIVLGIAVGVGLS